MAAMTPVILSVLAALGISAVAASLTWLLVEELHAATAHQEMVEIIGRLDAAMRMEVEIVITQMVSVAFANGIEVGEIVYGSRGGR